VKRLYDLVKIRDEALRCAFFYALRDSLVANDLEQASRIAYSGNKRWARVVTLQVHLPGFVIVRFPGHFDGAALMTDRTDTLSTVDESVGSGCDWHGGLRRGR